MFMYREYIVIFVQLFFELLSWAVLIYILSSWVVGPGNRMYDFLAELTKPVLDLARKITPKMGMLDLSPVIAMLGLELVKNILIQIIVSL
jgi:YggT family protein